MQRQSFVALLAYQSWLATNRRRLLSL